MTYQETLAYLFSRLPMFQRIGAAAYKADLSNTLQLDAILEHPHKYFPCIHVAGTNGKGSTSHLLASILQESGYKVGLYTSPHLVDFRERIRVNGQMIAEEEVISFVNIYKAAFERIDLSFFEWTVGLAFHYFKKQQIDIAVIETGMGGRLDSTNVIDPILSIITNISYDHQQFLGNTLDKIAGEKAGIIKTKVPVIIGRTQEETQLVFHQKALKEAAPIYFVDQNKFEDLPCPLQGIYQKENKNTVRHAVQLLRQMQWNISPENEAEGFRNVIANTGLMGRWTVLHNNPKVITDVGHNEDGIRMVLQQLKATPHDKLHMVFGVVSDKNPEKVLQLLPKEAHYYFAKPSIPRGMEAGELQKHAQECGISGKVYAHIPEAFIAAWQQCRAGDLIFVGGSTFVAADFLAWWPTFSENFENS